MSLVVFLFFTLLNGLGLFGILEFISRPARPRTTTASRRDPTILPEHDENVHREPAQRLPALPYYLRQVPLGPGRVAHPWYAELQHVHLAKAEEQKAAAVPRGDLGRGGGCGGSAESSRQGACAALALA